jgi:hypothetical protein
VRDRDGDAVAYFLSIIVLPLPQNIFLSLAGTQPEARSG